MRLYSRAEAVAIDDPKFGHIVPAEDGGFDLPDELFDRLHQSAVRGEKQWETSIERQHRLIAAEAARRADPKTLLDAVEQLVQAAKDSATPEAETAAPKSRRSRRKGADTDGAEDDGTEGESGRSEADGSESGEV
jgi:hypothetical protein